MRGLVLAALPRTFCCLLSLGDPDTHSSGGLVLAHPDAEELGGERASGTESLLPWSGSRRFSHSVLIGFAMQESTVC